MKPPTDRLTAPPPLMPAGVRKFTLAAHIGLSVGWLGAVAAYLVLDVTVAIATEGLVLRSAYVAMDLIARFALAPLALMALITGVVISLGTKWGLFDYWWVLISFVLTTLATIVLLAEIGTINQLGALAADQATSDEALRAAGGTLPHSVGGALVLLLVLFLNVYKPSGLTRYGWRRRLVGRSVAAPDRGAN